jgi:hypothetical protein
MKKLTNLQSATQSNAGQIHGEAEWEGVSSDDYAD